MNEYANRNEYEMIIAKVNVGRTFFSIAKNADLTTPPKDSSSCAYDSVNNGDGVYVIYTNYKAYPKYIIQIKNTQN